MSQQSDVFLLGGGLDLTSPPLAVKPGRALSAVNYEVQESGYRRVDGYERMDGRPAPSDAFFDFVRYSDRAGVLVAGQDVAIGAASGRIIAHEPDPPRQAALVVRANSTAARTNSPLWRASATVAQTQEDVTTGAIVVANASAAIGASANIVVGGSQVARVAGAPARDLGPTEIKTGEYRLAAQAQRRALIQAVPGAGPVRGVWVYKGDRYAFRNDVGQNAGGLYRATPTGWQAVTPGQTIAFASGDVEPAVGSTLSRGDVTAVVRQVVVTGGSWAANDAAGYLVISGASGTFAAGAASTTGGGVLTLSGEQRQIVLPAATRPISWTNHDFATGESMFFTTGGAGRAFEFDGSTFYPIRAIPSDDKDRPVLVSAYKNHLFLFYGAGSMLFSEIGDPRAWTTTGGAGEIALGSTPRDALSSETALIVVCRNKIQYLAGSDATDFTLAELSPDSGGWGGTLQFMGRAVYMDQRGLREVAASDTTAGFRMGTLSADYSKIVTALDVGRLRPRVSLRSVRKDVYRVFFQKMVGGEILATQALSVYFGGGRAEATEIALPFHPYCAASNASTSDEVFSGDEVLLMGGADGMVYEMDRGTSFDGAEISAYVRLPYVNQRSPHIDKRFHSIEVEVDTVGPVSLGVAAEFDYADGERRSMGETSSTLIGGGGFWDEAAWNEAVWSAPSVGTVGQRIDGCGRNMSLFVASGTAAEQPHTLMSVRVNWTQRKYRR